MISLFILKGFCFICNDFNIEQNLNFIKKTYYNIDIELKGSFYEIQQLKGFKYIIEFNFYQKTYYNIGM